MQLVVVPAVIGEDLRTLGVRQIGQPSRAVVHQVGPRHQVLTTQIGITLDRRLAALPCEAAPLCLSSHATQDYFDRLPSQT